MYLTKKFKLISKLVSKEDRMIRVSWFAKKHGFNKATVLYNLRKLVSLGLVAYASGRYFVANKVFKNKWVWQAFRYFKYREVKKRIAILNKTKYSVKEVVTEPVFNVEFVQASVLAT